jgi:hypothetical protein
MVLEIKMKTTDKLILVACFIAFFLPGLVKADDWSKDDTLRQGVVLVLMAVDWQQTQEIAKHPELYSETNPVIGNNPTVHGVDNYFLASAIIKTGISYALPAGKWREAWQYVNIGFGIKSVANNYNLGIRIQF